MKKSIYMLLFAALISHVAMAQKIATDKVPSVVTTAFKSKYPNVTAAEWKMKGSSTYEANFKLSNEDLTASFDNSGKWIETQTHIKSTALPAAVQTAISTNFADYKTEQASRVQSASNGNCYEAEVAKGADKYEVTFASDGKVLTKTKMDKVVKG